MSRPSAAPILGLRRSLVHVANRQPKLTDRQFTIFSQTGKAMLVPNVHIDIAPVHWDGGDVDVDIHLKCMATESDKDGEL